MTLCQCINMPHPPGVPEGHECVTAYNARNAANCQTFLQNCQACGNDEQCQRAQRDLYIQACLGSLYQLADCLEQHEIDPPVNGSWYGWVNTLEIE